MNIEQMTRAEINEHWRTAVDQADPTSGNAHFHFARAILAARDAQWAAAQQRVLAEQAVPVAYTQFLTDVTTAAGLIEHGKQDKKFAARLGEEAARLRTEHFASPPAPREAQTSMVLVPDWKGYALLGAGRYIINHSADFDPALGAELFITLATEEDRAGDRKIGETRDSRNPGQPVESEDMVLRIGFLNERGLFALEDQLRIIRETHFAVEVAQPATEQAEAPSDGCRHGIAGYCTECNKQKVLREATQPTASAEQAEAPIDADPLTPEQEEWVMDLAEKHNLGRRVPQIGAMRGVAPDVFYTDASYRTHELFCFAAALLSTKELT